MKTPTLLFACICLCALQTKAQSTLNLSEWATANKAELTYQNNTYQSGSYMLSDGSRISYLKKTATLEQEQNNTKENKLSLSIFPNPSDGNFELEILNSKLGIKNAVIKIYDVLGREIYKSEITNQSFKIQNLKSGVYFLQLQSEQGIVSQKIVVQ